MAKKIDKWLMHLFYKICFIPAVLCAGYMFLEDESIGWIIAGFVGGALLPFIVLGAVEGLIEGLLEVSFGENTTPAYTDKQLRDIAYYGVLSGKYKE